MATHETINGEATTPVRQGLWQSVWPWIRRFSSFGFLLLAINLALPVVFRLIIEDGTDEWEKPNQFAWLVVLPLLQCLANGLPRPRQWGGIAPQRSWLPLMIFNGWIMASGVHLWCVGYVGELAFQPFLLAPVLWALAWTAYNRLTDFTPSPTGALRNAMLFAPALITILGAFAESSAIFLTLTSLNIVIYGCLYAVKRDRQIALQLLLASFAALIAAMPEFIGRALIFDFTRGRGVAAGFGGYVLMHAILSRRPDLGLCGALVAAMAPGFLFPDANFHLALQTGFIALLIHSLRWVDMEQRGARALQCCTAVTWTVHAFVWTHCDGTSAGWIVSSAAVLVFLGCLVARIVAGRWAALIVPTGAALSFLAAPVNLFLGTMKTWPAGLPAILVSFSFYCLGTVLALTNARWQPAAVCIRSERGK